MRNVDPVLQPVLFALAAGMRALGVQYCLIGALVPELLLDDPPPRRTNDADAVVFVATLDDFERIKRDLAPHGFRATALPYRLAHASGGRLDLLPYSQQLAPDDKLVLAPDLIFTVTGFDRIAGASLQVKLESGDEIPVVPLPLYVLLKLVAFADRPRWKDPAGAVWCLCHYPVDDDRRFGLEHGEELVPYEMTTAYLAGVDARPYLTDELRRVIAPVLATLSEDTSALDSVAGELGWLTPEGEYLHPIDDTFRWFRAGLGL
jgi:predicted nucleotidyltransferase